MKQQLLDKINSDILNKRKWESKDFVTSQVLLWVAVVSSFVTAIVAVDKAPRWITASLAAISGMIILIDKNFSYSKRSTWNKLFRIKLERLLIDVTYANDTPEEIKPLADKFTDLEENMAREFPNAMFEIKN